MLDRVKLKLHFDPQRLQNDLHQLQQEAWIAHFVTQNYTGEWSVIPLRGPASATHPVMMIYSDPACTHFSNTPFIAACDYFQSVLDAFRCPLMAARLMKLTAGSYIKEHTDHDLTVENGLARLHIPIVTNEKVDFRLNKQRVVLNPGECWYLRLSDPHSVLNAGHSDRVHLVLDVQVNDWLLEQMN
ncbi:aspartyl/asparaginyl beta-hydroxylase domain-containing protein [Pseudoalteromonas sp. MMG022]|uniref:aspartyl/asparaginyl beta-hydroxylase domain-containing protein n=1 Tax=Pseudoalteromonas sp. MMG022 TaxID=2909978 RepID=UPI001F434DC8|nr:aspartyl/asparaginyl beta-hydroxylase domain-containing protein [Pseudoalteromonas sp. MMG022]MCF6434244.1 aspartyl/asparaginyl beta-hydroxylase domain-containing protein [Pseudoalteromonas sp. MMG022]